MQLSSTRFRKALLQTSKGYRVAMMVTFIAYFILSWAVMQSIIDVPKESVNELILRAFIEASLLVGICHCLVRPYLRLNLLGSSVSLSQMVRVIIYLLFVSVVYFLLSYGAGYLPFVQSTNINKIQVLNAEGVFEGTVSKTSIYILGVAQSFAILSLWTVTYLVWKFYDNKKHLHSEVEENRLIRLTSQLHPHFLFNTLNSIRALVFIDQEKAANVITSLSELLRSQMYSQFSTAVSFKDDWQTGSTYLAIETVRFDDRLSVEVNIDDDSLNQKLPPLTVLTLLENAIKHGVSSSKLPTTIRITSGLKNQTTWFLTVENSAFGSVQQSGSRVGLRNVRERLELMFGDGVVFSAGRQEQKFTVSMELPYVESPDH